MPSFPPIARSRKPSVSSDISAFEYVVGALLASGIVFALSQHFYAGRLSTKVYLSYVALHICCATLAVYRKNLLSAILGTSFTVVLLVACLIERAAFLPFDASLTWRVYRPDLLAEAYCVMLASTCAYWLIVVWFAPRQDWTWPAADLVERAFAARFAWVALWAGVVLTALTTSGGFIAEERYGSAEHFAQHGALAGNSGLALLSGFLLVIGMMSAVRCWGYKSNGFRLFVAISAGTILYFRWFRGQRSSSLPVLLTIVFLFHMNSRLSQWKKVFALGAAALALIAALNIWSTVRDEASRVGTWNAVNENLDAAVPNFDRPLEIKMLPQSYWHLLHTINLYQTGVRLNGNSFTDLVPQSIPDFLAKAAGYERPPSGPVRLYNYCVHGGGMFILGEGYWNFGIAGALLVAILSALLAVKLEAWFRRQEPIVVCSYFATIGTLSFGVYYGLQTYVKSVEIALALGLLMKFALTHMRKQYQYRSRLLQYSTAHPGIPSVVKSPVLRTNSRRFQNLPGSK